MALCEYGPDGQCGPPFTSRIDELLDERRLSLSAECYEHQRDSC
jgi:hypothetical protein